MTSWWSSFYFIALVVISNFYYVSILTSASIDTFNAVRRSLAVADDAKHRVVELAMSPTSDAVTLAINAAVSLARPFGAAPPAAPATADGLETARCSMCRSKRASDSPASETPRARGARKASARVRAVAAAVGDGVLSDIVDSVTVSAQELVSASFGDDMEVTVELKLRRRTPPAPPAHLRGGSLGGPPAAPSQQRRGCTCTRVARESRPQPSGV